MKSARSVTDIKTIEMYECPCCGADIPSAEVNDPCWDCGADHTIDYFISDADEQVEGE